METEPKTIQTAFRVPVSMMQAIRALAETEDRTLSAMMVRLIKEALAARDNPTP